MKRNGVALKIPAVKHVHTYVKYKNNRFKDADLFKCADPYCQHFADKSFCEGKASLCNNCGDEFILTPADLKRSKPRCLKCSNTAAARKLRDVKNVMENIFPEDEQVI